MKTKSLKNKFFAGLLALTLCTSTFTTIAHALPEDPKPVDLQIKKVLNMPETGVTTPTDGYQFVFTKHSLNRDEGKKNELPDINLVNINGFTADMTTDADDTKEGRQVTKNSSNILASVTFDKSGQYTYTVTENTGSKEGMTYSKASYIVSIFVEKKGDKYIPTSVQIAKTKDDKGAVVTSPTKQEYTPDEGGTSKNNFVFNNNYDPKTGNDTPTGKEITDDDKKGFVLKKEIAGTNPNLDEEFKFSITAVKPKGSNSDATKFKYKIVYQDGGMRTKGEADYGFKFDVTLKHGERVVFSDVLLGTTVKAEETVDGGYTKDIKEGKINGTVVTVDNLKDGLAIGDNADGNFVVFQNTQQTATGIILNNLPFIVLALVAGLGIFFFVKNRREEEAEA